MLAAISAGNHRRSEIAAAVGRPAGALSHLLSGLADIGLVEQIDDALRDKRSVFRVTEPVVRLHQLITGRREPELVAGRAAQVWQTAADTVSSKIYGPHFEDLARSWCFQHAAERTVGGVASAVRPTSIGCPGHRGGHELDVVVTDPADKIIAIGEAKATAGPVGPGELERLDHIRALLPATRVADLPRLLVFGRNGCAGDLVRAASGRDDVELIDLDRLYTGE